MGNKNPPNIKQADSTTLFLYRNLGTKVYWPIENYLQMKHLEGHQCGVIRNNTHNFTWLNKQ